MTYSVSTQNSPFVAPKIGLLSKSAKFMLELELLVGTVDGKPNGSTLFSGGFEELEVVRLAKSTKNPEEESSGVKEFEATGICNEEKENNIYFLLLTLCTVQHHHNYITVILTG